MRPPAIPPRVVQPGPPPELRALRTRSRQMSDRLSHEHRQGPPQTPSTLVTIIDEGNLPTTVPKVFSALPVGLDADDSEGATWTATSDANQRLPVIVINQPAVVGDILVAFAVGGRWVAEKTGGPCSTTICVGACGDLPVYGATITIRKTDGTLVASCTTGSSGCCSFNLCGQYNVQVAYSGSTVYNQTINLPRGGTTNVVIGSGDGLVCCGGYAIPEILKLTDADGTIDFVYDPNYFYPLWTGGHAVQRSSSTVTTPNDICVVAAPTMGPVRICYQMICHAGQNPTFAVQRSWSWVYEQNTLNPVWYQDPSGFAPGQFCVTAPPTICGNPLTDTSSFGANPSSTSPFALSGTPVAALSNATADPVGGGIAISA